MIYLDNAATTGKKPLSVVKAVEGALIDLSANPGRSGHTPSVRAAEAVYNARKKLSSMFGNSVEENVIFTPSCTGAINFVIKGVLKRGDGIVLSSMEHNAVTRPSVTVNSLGCPLKVAEVIFGDSDATFRSFERTIDKDTRLVICTHASNVTGEIMPIKKIGELCKERGIMFLVDGAQTAGVLPIDLNDMNIDFLCIAPHKGLYAPMGIGVLIANKMVNNPLIEGGTGVNSLSLRQPEEYPERLESGTLNLPGIMGISAGVDFVNKKGIDNLYSAELKLIQILYSKLEKKRGVILYSPYPQREKFVPVLSFNIVGKNSVEVAERLNNMGIAVRGGLHCAPLAHKRLGTIDTGTVRVSVSAFNTSKDIDIFLWAIDRILN